DQSLDVPGGGFGGFGLEARPGRSFFDVCRGLVSAGKLAEGVSVFGAAREEREEGSRGTLRPLGLFVLCSGAQSCRRGSAVDGGAWWTGGDGEADWSVYE